VGWQNYHEQWLSEGISQYFAALYAQHAHGDDTFDTLIRQMRRWALRYSDEGPIYLGYRLGHVKGQTRIFRALVYNKAALVLHMLRRLIGDDPFFAGLRRFYREHKYDKAGSDDLRLAMEAESGRSLDRFFDGWIYGSGLPDLRLDSTVQDDRDGGGSSVTLRFTQTGEIFDLPVTVTLVFQSGARRHLVVPVTDRVVEMTVPLEEPLRTIELNTDNAALAEIDA